jgi:hypothetical protein
MEPKRVDEIYDQIGKFSVDLPSDAWALGPKHIHEMISLTRGYINTVSLILQEILQERQNLDRSRHGLEAVFKIESDRLLAEDERVRRQPNIDDRKSTVNLILRDRLTEIQTLEGQLLDLGYVEKAVRHRYNELKSTMSDIRAQRALIRDAIDSGSFYGDETGTSRGSSTGAPSSDFSEDEINRSMAELNDMLLSGQEPTDIGQEAPEPQEQVTPSPAPEPQKATPEEDDFSDLIDGVDDAVVVEAVSAPPAPTTDPELDRFLDGDDLSNLFDDDTQSV